MNTINKTLIVCILLCINYGSVNCVGGGSWAEGKKDMMAKRNSEIESLIQSLDDLTERTSKLRVSFLFLNISFFYCAIKLLLVLSTLATSPVA